LSKIYELLSWDVSCDLWHPVIGRASWRERSPGEGRIIVFSEGPEQGNPLVVDVSILFDDTWILLT
jgi:hypothetical protein